jgi:hypothetical protein
MKLHSIKAILLSILVIVLAVTARAQDRDKNIPPHKLDSVNLITDASGMAYYQKTVKLDSAIKLSTIYTRVLEFMAARNFQQTYGYEQEGRLIFTTSQDLNMNPKYSGDNDDPDTYTVQFSITVDMRNGRYRYTINNVIFYLGSQSGNRRMPLYELYQMEINGDSRRLEKNARNLIESFEKYLMGLTTDLHIEIQHKAPIYNQKF